MLYDIADYWCTSKQNNGTTKEYNPRSSAVAQWYHNNRDYKTTRLQLRMRCLSQRTITLRRLVVPICKVMTSFSPRRPRIRLGKPIRGSQVISCKFCTTDSRGSRAQRPPSRPCKSFGVSLSRWAERHRARLVCAWLFR